MFKRFMLIVGAIILLVGLTLTYSAPLFYKKNKMIEGYVGSNSSLARIENLTFFEFVLKKGVQGESVRLEIDGFNLEHLLKEFNAKVFFIEEIEGGISYYGYSPKIPYEKLVNGKTINLHVFVSSTHAKVGSPIIFGSY